MVTCTSKMGDRQVNTYKTWPQSGTIQHIAVHPTGTSMRNYHFNRSHNTHTHRPLPKFNTMITCNYQCNDGEVKHNLIIYAVTLM